MEYRDYYAILGVPRTATAAEIKKAFRRLAREHHPDRNPGDDAAERRFKDLNEANAVLSDPERRRQYDALGADWARFGAAGGRGGPNPFAPGSPFAGWGAAAGGPGGARAAFRTGGADPGFSDFFRVFFGADAPGAADPDAPRDFAAERMARRRARGGPTFEEILGGLGIGGAPAGRNRAARGGTAPRPDPEAGAPVEVPVELSLEEAFHGTARRVELDGRRYEVAIPAGVDTGSRVRLAGRGPGGRDAVVVIRITEHDRWVRRGLDLEAELPVTLREALLGAEVPVVTPKGGLLLTIPAGTQPGRTFRCSGQGMPAVRGDGRGDLLLRIRVVLPAALAGDDLDRARDFLDRLGQPDPRAG